MNTLLIYFAFPIAIIIFSIILQKLLHSPIAVAALIFATFLIVTFTDFDQNFLIETLAYTILSFITSLLTQIFRNDIIFNYNNNSSTKLCDTLNNVIESNNNTNTNDSETCYTENNSPDIPIDDNVIKNNCGYMYNRRCRRF